MDMQFAPMTCLIRLIFSHKGLASGILATAAAALVSCGGSSGSSGGGQKPDPVAADFPIAYIERPIPVDEDGNPVFPSLLNPIAFNPGAKVLLKERATVQAAAVNITAAAFAEGALYDVKDLSVHPEGDRLLFSMRAPRLANTGDEDQPTWNIWEYNLRSKSLRRIISSDIVAEAGQDISPHYLPSGYILFSSTRQVRGKSILLDDGKPQFSALEEGSDMPAFSLHVMKADGSDIQQITYNQSHDLQPLVMQDGRIIFTRWDQFGQDKLSFYTANPDGTQLARHYGFLSLNPTPASADIPTNRLFNPWQLPDGRIAAILKPDGALLGGEMVSIDSEHFLENDLPVGATETSTQTAQSPISPLPVNINPGTLDAPEFSRHGRYSSLSPLYDGTNRLLVSWSECRLVAPVNNRLVACTDSWLATAGVREAPPLYGIWIFNINAQSQQPVVLAEEGKLFHEAVAMGPRAPATYLPSAADSDLAKNNVGLLHIRSVYDMDGSFHRYGVTAAPANIDAMARAPADQRPARFVRFIKAVSIPDEVTRNALSPTTYGDLFNQFAGRREILGYAPVEPDGSVQVQVPADVAFTLEVLDKDGKRIGSTHNNWLQLRPGEVRECNGCHSANNRTAGHGRPEAEPASINPGAATSGAPFPGTVRFDNLAIPESASMGETMAEFAARTTYCLTAGDANSCSPFSNKAKGTNLRLLSVNLTFNDEWTDTSLSTATASFNYSYKDLFANPSSFADLHAPTSEGCAEADGWTSLCRITINYEQHIQPLWERSRPVNTVDRQCSSCHTAVDLQGNQKVPDGQLNLGRTKNAANQPMLSYNQLLNARNKQILNDGGTLTTQIPVCEFVVDNDEIPECVVTLDSNNLPTCAGVADCQFELDPAADAPAGKLLIDSVSGNPIPLLINIELMAPMNRGGARASAKFFSQFSQFDALTGTVDHRGFLNNSELKLLSEWLDTRANYYNDPFASVETN
ncbi:MAG TPA: hypothetical protein VN030_04995 [Cellvibrio sp.]|nr:hypothetical protein [Cellvibrio sp.]